MKYFIVFYDRSVREITEEQNNELVSAFMENDEKIQIGNSLITLKSIQKVLDENDYFKEYPDKKPVVYENKFEKYESIEKRASSNSRWIKGIVKGIQQHIDEQGGAEHASKGSLELLSKWQKKLELYK